MRDINECYLKGASDLLQAINSTGDDYLTTLTLQGRLARAISDVRQYGSTDSAQAEIARVTTEFDRLCQVHLDQSFHSLCGIEKSLANKVTEETDPIIECEDSITVTDYLLGSSHPDEIEFKFPIRIKANEPILAKAWVQIGDKIIQPVSRTTVELECHLEWDQVVKSTPQENITIFVKAPHQMKSLAKKQVDIFKTPWRHMVTINRPDPCIDEEIECLIRVWNRSESVEQFELRASRKLLKIRFDEATLNIVPKVWNDFLEHDVSHVKKELEVPPNSVSNEVLMCSYKPTEPGVFAIYTYALRRSNRAYLKDNSNWRFSDYHQWHLIMVKL